MRASVTATASKPARIRAGQRNQTHIPTLERVLAIIVDKGERPVHHRAVAEQAAVPPCFSEALPQK